MGWELNGGEGVEATEGTRGQERGAGCLERGKSGREMTGHSCSPARCPLKRPKTGCVGGGASHSLDASPALFASGLTSGKASVSPSSKGGSGGCSSDWCGECETICVSLAQVSKCQLLLWTRRRDRPGQDEGNSCTVVAGQRAGGGICRTCLGTHEEDGGPAGS